MKLVKEIDKIALYFKERELREFSPEVSSFILRWSSPVSHNTRMFMIPKGIEDSLMGMGIVERILLDKIRRIKENPKLMVASTEFFFDLTEYELVEPEMISEGERGDKIAESQ